MNKQAITVECVVQASREKVWAAWTDPKHIVHWTFASNDWHSPIAENDVRTGGRFNTRMEAKNKSVGFDFTGTYKAVKVGELIKYTMDGKDARKVRVEFQEVPEGIKVVETFEPENENSMEMQKSGWQAILNNFKKYAESLPKS